MGKKKVYYQIQNEKYFKKATLAFRIISDSIRFKHLKIFASKRRDEAGELLPQYRVSGLTRTYKEDRAITIVAVVKYDKTITLKLGHSICHPNDSYDFSIGIDMAIKNAFNDTRMITTKSYSMLTPSRILKIVEDESDYICEHLDRYIHPKIYKYDRIEEKVNR
jgi:hypothetical protein